MAQIMNDEQRLAALAAYNPQEHLISVGTNKDKTPVWYYPAAWRLYELRLRHPHFTLEAEIVHMDEEKGTVIIKAIGYDGLDYASSNLKGTAFKQGKIFELDKVETKAKSRVARDIGIGTEYALDRDADETDGVQPADQHASPPRPLNAPRSQPQAQQTAQSDEASNAATEAVIPRYKQLYFKGGKKKLWTSAKEFYAYCDIKVSLKVNDETLKHLTDAQLDMIEKAIDEESAVEKAG